MLAFAQWLGSTPLSLAIQQRTWLVALLQAVHIIVIGIVFVPVLVLALRVPGRLRVDEPPGAAWARFSGWIWGGFAVMATTGMLLFVGEPLRQVAALSYWVKMALIAIGLLGVAALRRHPSKWLAGMLVFTWVAIIYLGRAIAYDVEIWGAWHLGA